MNERQQKRIAAVTVELLRAIGENPNRQGLRHTPVRVARAWAEFTAGYGTSPVRVLSTTFDETAGYDQMIVLRDIDFFSTCEHHLVPFYGTATVGYIPNRRVVGVSKLARLVFCFARRLQVQERLTQQVGDALRKHLKPRGYGVLVRATHLCMCARGIRLPRSVMVTTALGGVLRRDAAARAEFMEYCHG